MTNFEYIKQNLTELDLAYYEFPYAMNNKYRPELFSDKIFEVYDRWARRASSNYGNTAKGTYSDGRVIKEDPSIWSFRMWMYPNGSWRASGRTRMVSFSQWLNMQYKPEEWEPDGTKTSIDVK